MNKANLNPKFQNQDIDYLYHLGIDSGMDLHKMFGKIKYVVFTPSNTEAAIISREFAIAWYNINEHNLKYEPLYKTERFHLYKVGITLIISVGIGNPSLLIAMNEITKLLVHIDCLDITYFKLGFASGLDVEAGNIVLSHDCVDAKFNRQYKSIECGKSISYPLLLDETLTKNLEEFCLSLDKKNVIYGKCQSTKFSIEEQCNLSNLISPEITNNEINSYLRKAYDIGVRAIDMESAVFASFCNQLDIDASIINVIINNLFKNTKSQTLTNEHLKSLANAAKILVNFIQTQQL